MGKGAISVPSAFDGYRLIQQGKRSEAEKSLKQTLHANPKDEEALYLLGSIYVSGRLFEKGASHLRKAIRLGRATPDAYSNLGAACLELGKEEEAKKAFELALELSPQMADAGFNLARLLAKTDTEAAIVQYQNVIEHNPNYFEALVNIADLYLRTTGDLDRARGYLDTALAVGPHRFEAYRALAQVFQQNGMIANASAAIEKARALAPEDSWSRWITALINLQLGRLGSAWEDYDTRFDVFRRKLYFSGARIPRWEGQPLERSTIYVWGDQGIGDDIIYGSFLPDLMGQARQVVFQCFGRLKPIFERSYPGLQVEGRLETGRAKKRVKADYHIDLPQLGRHFRRTFEDFPVEPKPLIPDPDLSQALSEKYKSLFPDQKIIGISWKSKRKAFKGGKISDLEDWVDLLKTPGCQFVCLQYGVEQAELDEFNEANGTSIYFDPTVDPLKDMEAAFAQCAAMDLVISTSNTTVHTAASIHKTTWLVLPQGRGQLWYWFLGRSDSPFYPTLRVFRYAADSLDFFPAWSSVLGSVKLALQDFVSEQS